MLSHTHPGLVARLADRLLRGDPQCHVVVDHQRSAPRIDGLLNDDPRLHRRTSERPGGWGGYGLVSAVIEGFEFIRRELDPEWVVLLSGQDYPVRPPAETREALRGSVADAHLSVVWRVPSVPGNDDFSKWLYVRYHYTWWSLPHLPPLLPPRARRLRIKLQHRLSLLQSAVFMWSLPRGSGTRIGLRRRQTPFSDTYPCWGGYQWIAVSRRGLETLAREIAARPELVALYERSVIPDESILQTILLNAPGLTSAQPNLTFQRPTGEGDAHAADLTLRDLPAVLASGRAFARKMHPARSGALMDALDRHIGLAP